VAAPTKPPKFLEKLKKNDDSDLPTLCRSISISLSISISISISPTGMRMRDADADEG